MNGLRHRAVLYSPGMVGFGHIRRNASIAQVLARSALRSAIVMIAEARQAGAFLMPEGVDSVTVPVLCKEADRWCKPRYLDVSNHDLVALRADVIAVAIRDFEPDVLIVDHLPGGAACELSPTLERLQRHGTTRCGFGLRDVLQGAVAMRRVWSDPEHVDALGDYHDLNWVCEAPAVNDTVRKCGLLDQADLPLDMTGGLATGLAMPGQIRQHVLGNGQTLLRFEWVEIVPELAPFVHHTDRVTVLGERNTVCEALSLEMQALRAAPGLKLWSIASGLFDALPKGPARFHEEKLGRPLILWPELMCLDRRRGAAFGIVLLGMDIAESAKAPRRLTEHLCAASEGVVNGAPLLRPMPKPVRVPNDTPPAQRSAVARSNHKAALPGHVGLTISPPWELRDQTPGAVAPAVVPATVRHISARCVAFRGPHAGDEKQFRLEERTTKFDDGTSSRDYVWVRGKYVLVVPVSDGRVVFIRQYKKAAGRTLLVLPWGGIEGDESPLDAGRRELEEETGYSFGAAEVRGPFYDLPDKSTGGHWVVVARDAYRKADPCPDEGEHIYSIELIPVSQLWQHQFPVLMHVGALRLAGL